MQDRTDYENSHLNAIAIVCEALDDGEAGEPPYRP